LEKGIATQKNNFICTNKGTIAEASLHSELMGKVSNKDKAHGQQISVSFTELFQYLLQMIGFLDTFFFASGQCDII
jgi:hypothetical protein